MSLVAIAICHVRTISIPLIPEGRALQVYSVAEGLGTRLFLWLPLWVGLVLFTNNVWLFKGGV